MYNVCVHQEEPFETQEYRMPGLIDLPPGLTSALELIAAELNGLPWVQGVALAESPDPEAKHPYQRLLVVVDDELADDFLARAACPALISYQDGGGDMITPSGDVVDAFVWSEEREETLEEAALSCLGVPSLERLLEDVEYDAPDDLEGAFSVLNSNGILEVFPVHADWASNIERITSVSRVATDVGDDGCEITAREPVFDDEEWRYAVLHHRVFDPATGTFGLRG